MRSGAMDFKGGESELKSPVGAGSARLPAAVRRAQLLDVARRVFGRDGYRGASMESIAEAAGVTKPVLYQHFPSKDALYRSLLELERRHLITVPGRASALTDGN